MLRDKPKWESSCSRRPAPNRVKGNVPCGLGLYARGEMENTGGARVLSSLRKRRWLSWTSRSWMARFSSARLWESPLAESRQYPAFDHENGGFYFSFIARFSDARWNNHCAIVVRQIAIGGVQVRPIVAGILDAGFFVGHNDGGHSPEELQGTWDPIQLPDPDARSPRRRCSCWRPERPRRSRPPGTVRVGSTIGTV